MPAKRGLAVAACLLVAAAAKLPPAAQPLSRADLPWWQARFIAKQVELRSGPVDLVWYGDSITQQFERASPQPWQDFAPVWKRFYAPRHAVDLGFNGDATSHLLWRIEHGEADGIHPKLAIVLIGANNFGHLHWAAAPTLLGVEAVVAALRQRLPDTRILLLGVLPSVRGAWVDANTAEVNRGLAARYRDGQAVLFRDETALFLHNGHVEADDFADPRLSRPAPPLHPTALTMARLAEAIEPDVSRLMADRNKPGG